MIPYIRTRRRWLLGMFLLWVPVASAQTPAESLAQQYVDQTLFLRHFYGGAELHYDARGTLVGVAQEEPWTLAMVHVKRVTVSSDHIDVQGDRVCLIYDRRLGKFRKVLRKVLPDEKKIDKVTIRAETEPELAAAVLASIFLSPDEPLGPITPKHWNYFFERSDNPVSAEDRWNKVLHVGPGISPPKVRGQPDPSYSEPARALKFQGLVGMRCVIGADGLVQDVQIDTPLGAGLDEAAVAAVQRWKFAPATQNGTPVPVWIHVEVNFRLF